MAANIEQSFSNPIPSLRDIKIFAIPGLGVDGRVYNRLSAFLPQIQVIEWLIPKPNESLQTYAARMAEPLKGHQGEIILMGTSFGAVVAQEISQFFPLRG